MPRPSRALVLSLLATLLVPLRASAAVPAPVAPPGRDLQVVTGHVRSLEDYVHAGFSPAQAVRVRVLDTLRASGVPVQQHVRVQAGHDPSRLFCDLTSFGAIVTFFFTYYPDLQPAGDLNADGRPDVIESLEVPRTKTTSTWVVHARDARSGRILWTHTAVHDQYHGGVAVATVLGSRPAPGVLLLTYGAVPHGSVGLTLDVSDDVLAVDGHHRRLWTHHDAGTADLGFTSSRYRHAPLGLEIAKLRHGAEDVLVTSYDGNSDRGVTGSLVRVGGASGRVDAPVPPISSTSGSLLGTVEDAVLGSTDARLPYLGTVPDQNGDRLADLYTARVGSTHVISVYGGVHGAPVWSSQLLPLHGFLDIADAGVVTQPETRVHDLALSSGLPGGLGLHVTLGLLPTVDGTVILAGAGTGSLVWVRPGQQAYPVGTVGGKPVLGTGTSTATQSTDGYTVDEELDVYDDLGVLQSRRHYTFTVHDDGCPIGTSYLLTGLGDLDGDRAMEVQVDFIAFVDDDKDPVREQLTTVRGRDGAELDHARAYSLGGSVDGRGIDRATYTAGKRSLGIKVVHGDTLKPMWSAGLALSSDLWGVDFYAMDSSPTGCSDVALLGYGKTSRSTALLASNGKAWWRVVYAPKQTEGRLVHERGARSLC
ncbi:MAG: hypothetical protein JWO22_3802 [Frankiales bacterium]|nr:hypothetical protein [Frankiales bacterium]